MTFRRGPMEGERSLSRRNTKTTNSPTSSATLTQTTTRADCANQPMRLQQPLREAARLLGGRLGIGCLHPLQGSDGFLRRQVGISLHRLDGMLDVVAGRGLRHGSQRHSRNQQCREECSKPGTHDAIPARYPTLPTARAGSDTSQSLPPRRTARGTVRRAHRRR